MTPDEVRERLSAAAERVSALRGFLNIDGKVEEVADMERQTQNPEFWNDNSRAQEVIRQKAALERSIKSITDLELLVSDAEVLLELGEEMEDAESIDEALQSVRDAEGRCQEMEILRLLGEEGDDAGAILEINAGAGGTDASDWAEMLKRMYVRWAEAQGHGVKLLDEQPNPEAGLKSCTLQIDGEYAYGYLKSEIGVHRLVRISPFDASARRHTCFASVSASPNIQDDIEIEINPSDLEIQTMRASGAGGQHVNTTDSAVRVIHKPSGIVVKCSNERSQHKNKATAMKILKGRLYQREIEARQMAADAANAQKKKIEWGSQIRNYVLHPTQRVKDARTGVEITNANRVLDGELNPFMEAWLAEQAAVDE